MLRFSDVKAICAKVLSYTSTDTRTIDVVNRACERLLEGMKAKGTTFRYRVCADNSCLVLPRQIETVEAFAICDTPGIVRNGWWEFVGAGPGVQTATSCFENQMIMNDEVASFANVSGTGKKLAIYNDVAESGTGYVILQFYNGSAQWVRTLVSGSYIDGERLTIPAAAGTYTYTTNFCMADGFVAAIKSRTNGTIRLFEYNPSTGATVPLAIWEPDEEVPRYRSLLIPGLVNLAAASDGEDCAKVQVVIRGKARFIPVFNDNDFLQIHSREAIRLAVQAIAKEEKDLMGDAANYWAMAFRVLDAQLDHYQGAGARMPIQIQEAGIAGPGVMNLI